MNIYLVKMCVWNLLRICREIAGIVVLMLNYQLSRIRWCKFATRQQPQALPRHEHSLSFLQPLELRWTFTVTTLPKQAFILHLLFRIVNYKISPVLCQRFASREASLRVFQRTPFMILQ